MNKVYVVAPDIDYSGLPEDKAKYYCHIIISQSYARKHEKIDFTPIDSQLMRYNLGTRDESATRNGLKDRKVISVYINEKGIEEYQANAGNGYCKKYSINPTLSTKMFEITDANLKAKILLHRSQRKDAIPKIELNEFGIIDTKNEINKYIDNWLKQFSFDTVSCIKEVSTNVIHLIPVCEILNGQIEVKEDDYGRRHNPYTRLFTPLRKHIHYNNDKLTNNDISNSQLCNFQITYNKEKYKEIIKETNQESHQESHSTTLAFTNTLCSVNTQKSKFNELVEQGKIYDYLLEQSLKDNALIDYLKDKQCKEKQKEIYKQMRLTYYYAQENKNWNEVSVAFRKICRLKDIHVEEKPVTRNTFKKFLFADVFYGRWQVFTPLTALFKTLFPDEYKFIIDYKKAAEARIGVQEGYKELAREMQRQESHLIYNCIINRLRLHHPEIPVLVIHDSIMTTTEHSPTVQRVMREEYKRAGLTINVK